MTRIFNGRHKSVIRTLWEKWKRFGKRLGDLQARFILFLFYFAVLGPFSLVIRCGGGDPLGIKAPTLRGWRPREDRTGASIERATKQF